MACVIPLGSHVSSFMHGCSAPQVAGPALPVPVLVPQTPVLPPATSPSEPAVPRKGFDTCATARADVGAHEPASESESGGQSSQTAQQGVGREGTHDANIPNTVVSNSRATSERFRAGSLRCSR